MSKVFGNRYEIIERIGAGGMAIVYKAKDLLLNRVVTVKVLREQFTADEEFVRRFRREAQSAASLSHPNVVSIYDVGRDGETEYIVMEYVEGRNLKELIRDYAPLSMDQTLNLGIQIAEAIHHAHEHKIIHRDIKPHNILVTADGRAKVTDFGIARAVSSATMTHTGDIVGSVHYLSPEQAKGVQTNEQSDVYSLGIILYELLTAKVPYDGETPVAIALKHLQEQAAPPSKINPKVIPALEKVVLRAIAKSTENRYATAKEMVEDLRNIKAGQPISQYEFQEEEDLDTTRIHRTLVTGVQSALDKEDLKNEDSEEDDRKSTKGKRRSINWKRLAGITAILLVFLVGGGMALSNFLSVDTTTVPPLVGKTMQDADIFVKDAGLFLNPEVNSEFHDEIEKNHITRTEPSENSVIKKGRYVKIWISKGPESFQFPDLGVGKMTEEDAVNKLESLGFRGKLVKEIDEASNEPAGTVIAQSVMSGSEWSKSGDVKLTLSGGSSYQSFRMPIVIGKTVEEAKKELEQQYNLTVTLESDSSTEYPESLVMDTNPKPGETVKQGQVVTLIVSTGPGPLAFDFGNPIEIASNSKGKK